MCLAIQNGLKSKYLHFDNRFTNGHLNRPVYVELPENSFTEIKRRCRVMKPKRCLYGLKDAAKVRNHLLFDTFRKMGLKEMDNATCIF